MRFSLHNGNWREYIKKGERVTIQSDVAPSICLLEACKPLLATVVVWLLMYVGVRVDNGPVIGLFLLTPLFVFIGFGWFLWRLVLVQGIRYVLTDEGIYKIYGVISKNVKYVPYKKITDVQIMRGMFEQMFGVGSVGVATASGGNMVNGRQMNELTILGATEYRKINEHIFKKIK